MTTFISCLEHKVIKNKLRIDYSGILPAGINSLENALNPQLWISHNQAFASAIHDEEQLTTILVRDHLGMEPLYYHYANHRLIVAQTIGQILQHLPSHPNYNHWVIKKMRSGSGSMDYTDETHYQGIYRVEPGHIMKFKHQGSVLKKSYWALSKEGPSLYYKEDKEYVEHFASLMDEAVLNAVGLDAGHCASEFSAGLDSSAIYCAARNLGISPTLFMHTAPPGISNKKYNDSYEQSFIEHFQISKLHRIGAESFKPIKVFEEYANWFAGPAPLLFVMFAEPLHQAVAAGKYPILLSGFGGDQCVSSPVVKNFYVPQLIREHDFQRAWHDLFGEQKSKNPLQSLKRLLRFASMAHSWPYAASIFYKQQRWQWGWDPEPVHPYYLRHYSTQREAEYSLVQGVGSNEVRMRIEYSSIVAKKLGFSYRYPLLYPKLLEFMLSLPLEQKRTNGQGRHLMRRYLEYKLGKPLFQSYKKNEGLPIFHSTLDAFQQTYEQGAYDTYFNDLSKPWGPKLKNSHYRMIHQIQELMLRYAESKN